MSSKAGWWTRLALVVCLAGWAGSIAAGVPVYTLEDCLRIGLERSGDVRNALRDRAIAETTIGEIGAQVQPQVSVGASYRRLDELQTVEFGGQSIALGSLDNTSAGLTVRQLLYAGGSVRAALRAARDYRALETQRAHQVQATLVRDIRAGFADLLLLEEQVRVQALALEQLRAMVEQTEQRYRQDQVAEFDLLNARVQYRNAAPDLIRAENDLAVARMAFRNLLNLEASDFAIAGELRFEPYTPSLEDVLAAARRLRPELRIMEQQVRLRASDRRIEQGAYFPALHASFHYGGENPATGFSTESGWDWGWYAGVQLSWSWLDGGLRRHRVRRKGLELEQAEESLDMMRRAVDFEARQALLRVEHAAQAVGASRENVALAERSMEIAATRYEQGMTTRLEYTEVQLALTRARLNWWRALRDHHHAVNALRYAMGSYLPEETGADQATKDTL